MVPDILPSFDKQQFNFYERIEGRRDDEILTAQTGKHYTYTVMAVARIKDKPKTKMFAY